MTQTYLCLHYVGPNSWHPTFPSNAEVLALCLLALGLGLPLLCSASQGIMFPRCPCLWHLCWFSQWTGGGLGVMPGCFPSSPRLCGVPGRTKSPRWAWAPREGPGSVGSALICWPAAVLVSGSWTPSVIPLAQGGTNRLVCLTTHALGPQLFYCLRN